MVQDDAATVTPSTVAMAEIALPAMVDMADGAFPIIVAAVEAPKHREGSKSNKMMIYFFIITSPLMERPERPWSEKD